MAIAYRREFHSILFFTKILSKSTVFILMGAVDVKCATLRIDHHHTKQIRIKYKTLRV
jgi:hypothetical protein